MTYPQFLLLLIEYTENRALVLARQSEVLSLFTHNYKIPFAATFLIELGMPVRPTGNGQ